MMYCGWPYYAWSAGYDTALRGERALAMYTTDDPELLDALTGQERDHASVAGHGPTGSLHDQVLWSWAIFPRMVFRCR